VSGVQDVLAESRVFNSLAAEMMKSDIEENKEYYAHKPPELAITELNET